MAEDEYTVDPDLFESDRLVGRAPMYGEESGVQRGSPTKETLRPCPSCGVRVITGVLANGTHIVVESEVPMYTMAWRNRAPLPSLTVSRGYPEHQCRMTGG